MFIILKRFHIFEYYKNVKYIEYHNGLSINVGSFKVPPKNFVKKEEKGTEEGPEVQTSRLIYHIK